MKKMPHEDAVADPSASSETPFRFDPVDIDQVRLLLNLSPGERIRVMLDAQELAKGCILPGQAVLFEKHEAVDGPQLLGKGRQILIVILGLHIQIANLLRQQPSHARRGFTDALLEKRLLLFLDAMNSVNDTLLLFLQLHSGHHQVIERHIHDRLLAFGKKSTQESHRSLLS